MQGPSDVGGPATGPVGTDHFQVDLGGMVDLLSHHLYSGPGVYLRELLQNAVDALAARRATQPGWTGRVLLEVGPGSLTVSDNGIGLTASQARELLATIGHSSKRDALLGGGRRDYIGQFGIGLLAAFMVADRIEVLSLSVEPGAAPIRWEGRVDGTFTLARLSPAEASAAGLSEPGTRVSLVARPGCHHWLETTTVASLARRYGSLLPEEVLLQTEAGAWHERERLTDPDLPWHRGHAAGLQQQAALEDYCRDLFGWTPLAVIPLSAPAAGASGVAFVLPQAVAAGSGRHRVYVKRMLVGEAISSILPEWAFFVRAVVNADALTPTASRENLHDDAALASVRQVLGDQLKAWMTRTLASGSPLVQAFIDTHHLALRALATRDDDVLDLVARVLPYETTGGEMTLARAAAVSAAGLTGRWPDDSLAHALPRQTGPDRPGPCTDQASGGVVLYAASTQEYGRIQPVARAQGLTVVNAGYTYDAEVLSRLAHRPGWRVRPVTVADVSELLAQPDPDRQAQALSALREAEALLARETGEAVRVELRRFEPSDLPAIVLIDRDAQRVRALSQQADTAGGLWGGLLGSLAQETQEPDEPLVRLVLNDASVTVHQLIRARGTQVFAPALLSVHLAALMLSGQQVGGLAARRLGGHLAELIGAALSGTACRAADAPGAQSADGAATA